MGPIVEFALLLSLYGFAEGLVSRSSHGERVVCSVSAHTSCAQPHVPVGYHETESLSVCMDTCTATPDCNYATHASGMCTMLTACNAVGLEASVMLARCDATGRHKLQCGKTIKTTCAGQPPDGWGNLGQHEDKHSCIKKCKFNATANCKYVTLDPFGQCTSWQQCRPRADRNARFVWKNCFQRHPTTPCATTTAMDETTMTAMVATTTMDTAANTTTAMAAITTTAMAATDDHANVRALATPVQVGQEVYGSIEVTDDVDWFSVFLEGNSWYTFTVTSSGHTKLDVRGNIGAGLVGDDHGINSTLVAYWNLQGRAGFYGVEVSAYANQGPIDEYTLVVTQGKPLIPDDHGEFDDGATLIQVDERTLGRVDFAGDLDWFSFFVPGGLVEVEVESTLEIGFNVLDRRGSLIAWHRCGFVFCWAEFLTGGGTYYIQVAGRARAEYEVRVLNDEDYIYDDSYFGDFGDYHL